MAPRTCDVCGTVGDTHEAGTDLIFGLEVWWPEPDANQRPRRFWVHRRCLRVDDRAPLHERRDAKS